MNIVKILAGILVSGALVFSGNIVTAQSTNAKKSVPERTPLPTRDPHAPGYVAATELPDGTIPSPDSNGNFIIGPTHNPAPEITVQENVPQGTIYQFTMDSKDSKIYPGIAREPGTFGTVDSADPAKLIVTTSHRLHTLDM